MGGLNEQELEMRSILVRVHQELVKAAVNTRHQQETNSQEEQQAPAAQVEGLKSPPEELSVEEEKCNLGDEKRNGEGDDLVKVVVDQIGQEQGKTGEEVDDEVAVDEVQLVVANEVQLVVADEVKQDS